MPCGRRIVPRPTPRVINAAGGTRWNGEAVFYRFDRSDDGGRSGSRVNDIKHYERCSCSRNSRLGEALRPCRPGRKPVGTPIVHEPVGFQDNAGDNQP